MSFNNFFDNLVNDLPKRYLIENVDALISSMTKVIIYGFGGNGKKAQLFFEDRGIEVIAFWDSDGAKWGTSEQGTPITKIQADIADVPVIIASGWAKDISETLLKHGVTNFFDFTNITYLYTKESERYKQWASHFDSSVLKSAKKNLDALYRALSDEASRRILSGIVAYRLTMKPQFLCLSDYDQYFHPHLAYISGSIVDCGAWQGDVTVNFLKMVSSDPLAHVYAFEPDAVNFRELVKNCKRHNKNNRLNAFNMAVCDFDGQANFESYSDSSMSGVLEVAGEGLTKVCKLDTVLANEKIYMIKFDIEGAELDALAGVRNTILRETPILAISVYHKCDDLWNIFSFVKDLRCGYKFYLGHHNQHLHESVLYCYTDRR